MFIKVHAFWSSTYKRNQISLFRLTGVTTMQPAVKAPNTHNHANSRTAINKHGDTLTVSQITTHLKFSEYILWHLVQNVQNSRKALVSKSTAD